MGKANRRRFVKSGLICFSILFYLSFLELSYIYAANITGVAKEAESYRTKGYDAQQHGDIDTAIEWYQKAASLKPEYASPHNDLGILFETKGWLDRAEAEYEKALAIDPAYKEVHTNLALLYERKGELEKAAFHWMKRYKLGDPADPWTQEARSRLEKLGLLGKSEMPSPKKAEQEITVKPEVPVKIINPQESEKPVKKEAPVKKRPIKKLKPEAKAKKASEWTRIGSEKNKKEKEIKTSRPSSAMDKELQESLRLAEDRLRKERSTSENSQAARKQTETKRVAYNESNASYNKAKDYYNKGEYTKALDIIRTAKQGSSGNKALLDLENEIKLKMKEERIEDHHKEGMIRYRQKDFAGARKEYEAILSIIPE